MKFILITVISLCFGYAFYTWPAKCLRGAGSVLFGLSVFLCMLLMSGCEPDQSLAKPVEKPATIAAPQFDKNRITVHRIKIVPDSMAYEKFRGVYLIIDHQTGKEYVGVSGIGISELGQHDDCNEGQTPDER